MNEVEGGRMDEPGHRPSVGARRRLACLAAALFACALGSVPAVAQDLPPVTLLPVEEVQDEPPVPDGSTSTTAPAAPSTTAPAPTTPSTTTPPSVTPTGGPTTTDERGTGSRRRRGTSGRTRPTPAEQPPTTALVDTSHRVPPEGPALERLRDASLPAARQFSFPLGLGAAVLVFLAVQGRLDRRDPKLAAAPVSVRDDLLTFT